MPNITETSAVNSLPTPLSPTVAKGIATLVSKLAPPITAACSTYTIAAVDAPSEETRAGLERRAMRIESWMAPAGRERALVEVTALFTVMKHRSKDAVAAKAEMNLFVEDVFDIPFFALSEACKAFRRGATGEGKYVPTPGEVRIEAQKHTVPLAKERREILAILTAKVTHNTTSEDRKRQALEYCRGTVLPEMRAARPRNEWREDAPVAVPVETPEETLARLRSQPLPPLSEEARRKFVPAQVGEAAE